MPDGLLGRPRGCRDDGSTRAVISRAVDRAASEQTFDLRSDEITR